MKIESSDINISSQNQFELSKKSETEIEFHLGEKKKKSVLDKDFISNSSPAHQIQRIVHPFLDNLSDEERIKKAIVEEILNRDFQQLQLTKLYPHQHSSQKEIIGVSYKTQQEYHQKQTVKFETTAKIKTKDTTYDIDLCIDFSKELYEFYNETITIGEKQLIDPLVINFDTISNPFDNLSQLRFEFDLNFDGENELIPYLKKGAGYLAHDINNNNKIDNGSELFGVFSNDGFKDLAKFDQDQNNWIDENDQMFKNLKVWQIDESGENKLISLIDANIGAIYLSDVPSDYKYQEKIDQLTAIQKSNGIFIKEDGGGIGLINSIDIALKS